MPLPRWLAHINKRVFNPMEVRRSHPRCHRQPAPSARVIVGGMGAPGAGCSGRGAFNGRTTAAHALSSR